ncbi:hypothetical protein B0J18DRAFT_466109 [Chaetomium sp. MPI-SDFR-AT-0129]|nr:hypothetical protein B0J18DRAFT_466109 [Chaetomium sp. MPI-SDFR-AT-0129]
MSLSWIERRLTVLDSGKTGRRTNIEFRAACQVHNALHEESRTTSSSSQGQPRENEKAEHSQERDGFGSVDFSVRGKEKGVVVTEDSTAAHRFLPWTDTLTSASWVDLVPSDTSAKPRPKAASGGAGIETLASNTHTPLKVPQTFLRPRPPLAARKRKPRYPSTRTLPGASSVPGRWPELPAWPVVPVPHKPSEILALKTCPTIRSPGQTPRRPVPGFSLTTACFALIRKFNARAASRLIPPTITINITRRRRRSYSYRHSFYHHQHHSVPSPVPALPRMPSSTLPGRQTPAARPAYVGGYWATTPTAND